ncbi:MAG: flagella synthesis protein FlgN [Thiobacillaceae bacterium]
MSELHGRLDALSGLLRNLLDTLTLESEVLQRGDTEALAELTASKEWQARALAAGWTVLTDELRLSSPVTRQAIEQALNERSEPGVADAWSRIVGLIDETERLNRLNGRLIKEQLRRTQSALDILQSAASQQALYGADGHSVELLSAQRSIDEA